MSLFALLNTPIGRQLVGRAAASNMVAAALAGLALPGTVGQGVYEEPVRDEWSAPPPNPYSLAPEYASPLPQPYRGGRPDYWASGEGAAFDRPYNPYQPIPAGRDSWSWAHNRPPPLPVGEPTQPDDFAAPEAWALYWAARDRWLQEYSGSFQ